MEAIQTLKDEHARCRRVAAAARRRLIEPDQPCFAEIEEFIDFFRYYATTCHHPKEEDLLFRALHRRGLSWAGYPLHGLITDHHALHVTLESAADWLPLVRGGDHGAVGPLLHNLRVYLDRLLSHMDDEELVVFPMAEHWLTAADKLQLAEAFAAATRDEACGEVHEYYSGLAQRLAAA